MITLRERIHAIGGSLDIESAPGQGSTFTLRIPTSTEKKDGSEPSQLSVDQQSFISSALSGPEHKGEIRVLFADDHQIMRQGLVSMISGQTDIALVGEAENGQEAIRMARQYKPDDAPARLSRVQAGIFTVTITAAFLQLPIQAARTRAAFPAVSTAEGMANSGKSISMEIGRAHV